MFGFSTLQTGAAGLGIVGLLWWLYDNRAYLASILSKFRGSGVATDVPADPDELDMRAAKRLQARALRNKCTECQTAIKTYLAHFFTEGGT